MYYHRTLELYFKKAVKQFPVIMITGARQVGKTTFIKNISESRRTYISLDDPLILQLARNDPDLFFQRYRPPLIIDEIQYAPELLPYIKIEADSSNTNSLFWITGSQQFHLMKGISESLAGRVGILNLSGFSYGERLGFGLQVKPFVPSKKIMQNFSNEKVSLLEIYKLIFNGSYPAVCVNPKMDKNLFYSSYVQTYILRDVSELVNVGDRMAFIRFIKVAASRTAQLLNINSLANDANISPNTAKRWLSILEASHIIYLLQPFYSNISKRFIKSPKLYFLDTGLCSWLTEWSSPKTLEAGAFSGQIFESWVHNGLFPFFYFYRDKDKKEIDLLIEKDNVLYPVEIKKTATPTIDVVKHFDTLKRFNKDIGTGCCICFVKEPIPLKSNIFAISASSIGK